MAKITKALFLALLLSPMAMLAEIGDIHTVKVDEAFLRESADKSSPQMEKLAIGSEVMEMEIQGEWTKFTSPVPI